jgi:hypothetical protein
MAMRRGVVKRSVVSFISTVYIDVILFADFDYVAVITHPSGVTDVGCWWISFGQ